MDVIVSDVVDGRNTRCAMTSWLDLGVLRIGTDRQPDTRIIRAADPGLLHLIVNLQGEMTVDRLRLGPDEFVLLDGDRPVQVTRQEGLDAAEPVSIIVPVARRLVALAPQRLDRVLGTRMSGRDGVGALLIRFLRQLTGDPEQYRPPDAARLGTITLDLLAVSLAQGPVVTPDEKLLAQMHEFIERNLGDPELAPQTIAAAHHISTRTLHRIFRATGHTVSGWIRTRRLERCRHDLADTAQGSRPIQVIAARWSFPDKAHFSRTFRAEYGMSPQAFRWSMVNESA